MGCGCGGSTWTPAPPPGQQQDANDSEPRGPLGIDNPATFWTGPDVPAEPEPVAASEG